MTTEDTEEKNMYNIKYSIQKKLKIMSYFILNVLQNYLLLLLSKQMLELET